ncbi:MAG: hypothetical protein ACI8QS_001900 [Planctomycetota bacterium]|jgi:hypothetical protein
MRSQLFCFLIAFCTTSCVIFEDDLEKNDLSLEVRSQVASQHNFRGMPAVRTGVLQGEMGLSLPTKEEGTLEVRTWANMDLHNGTGQAWFPDGHAGKFSQIDFDVSWARELKGNFLKVGLTQYNLQHGAEFFIGERGETSEIFVSFTRPTVAELVPTLVLHYDFDEVEDFYIQGRVERIFQVREDIFITPVLSLGYSGEDMSLWNYGLQESALADLRLEVTGNYRLDERTFVYLTLSGSTILDSELEDWFEEDLSIESDNSWISAGFSWNL